MWNCTYYRMFNLKGDRILTRVIYLLRFTTCYITQPTCIYSKCWKWCPFISMHLSTRFTMFLSTFLTVLSFFNHFRNSTFYWRLTSIFQRNFVYSGRKTSFLNNFPKKMHVLPLLTALWRRKKWRSKTSTHRRLIQLIRMATTGSPLSCNSLANSCTCSSIMSYQQNHYK